MILRHSQGVNHCTGAKTVYATLVLTRSALSIGIETVYLVQLEFSLGHSSITP
jgi:hypothetical protein